MEAVDENPLGTTTRSCSSEPEPEGAAGATGPAVAAGSIQAPLLPPPVTASALAGMGAAGLNDSVSGAE